MIVAAALAEIVIQATPIPEPSTVVGQVVANPSSSLSYWLAPGGGLAAFAAAMLAAARMFRDGRREDVRTARAKEEAAEQRADEAERERDTLVEEVQRQLREVRRDLRERDEANDLKLREMAERHAGELQTMQRDHLEQVRRMQAEHAAERKLDQERIIHLVADNFRMQELLAGRGWEPTTGRLQSMAAAREALARAVDEAAATGDGDGTMGP